MLLRWARDMKAETKALSTRVRGELARWIEEQAKRNYRTTSQQIEMMCELARQVIESQPPTPDPVNSVREALAAYRVSGKKS
jgi:hypothetical protein